MEREHTYMNTDVHTYYIRTYILYTVIYMAHQYT